MTVPLVNKFDEGDLNASLLPSLSLVTLMGLRVVQKPFNSPFRCSMSKVLTCAQVCSCSAKRGVTIMNSRLSRVVSVVGLMLGAAVFATSLTMAVEPAENKVRTSTPADVFEQRIMPIFRSTDPSSCTECHLAGVELKNYISSSHEKTFLSLRDQGLIDVTKPQSSKILALIRMGEQDKTPALISNKNRAAEYSAFADWIVASCQDVALTKAPKLTADQLARPDRPDEVIRHARQDKVFDSFERSFWSQRFRCTSCHAADGQETARLIKEQQGDDFLWIQPGGAAETLRHLVDSGLVDVENPEKSLLLLKPTNQVKHGGGKKMEIGDIGYKAIRSWVEDYSKTVGNRYRKASELPIASGQNLSGTDQWLKIENTPPQWADKLLQVSLFRYDEKLRRWESQPIAISDRGVWGAGKLWQHTLWLVAPRDKQKVPGRRKPDSAEEKPALGPGRYLLKVHVDQQGRLAEDWQAQLGPADYAGQIEVNSKWPAGYGNMTVVQAKDIAN